MDCLLGWRGWQSSDGEPPSRRFGRNVLRGNALNRNRCEESVRLANARRNAQNSNSTWVVAAVTIVGTGDVKKGAWMASFEGIPTGSF